MQFLDSESPSTFHPLHYPDTSQVNPDCAPLPDASLLGIRGSAYYFPPDNLDGQTVLRPDDSLAHRWMDPSEQLLLNGFSLSQSSAQYTHHPSLYAPSLSDASHGLSPSLSQWDTAAVSHLNPPFDVDHYDAYHCADTADNLYRLEPNARVVGSYPDVLHNQGNAFDDAPGIWWDDGMDLRFLEQGVPTANDSPHFPASMSFTNDTDFSAVPVHSSAHSYDGCTATELSCYPTPPLSPQYLPHDSRHISLPAHGSPSKSAANRWKCPYCSYVQGRRRMVDLKRHMATHNKPSDVALWTCCGFPREIARAKGIPENVIGETSVIHGRVGGCWETFSRRDALQRHLRKQKGRCFGDAYADWHPGNTNKRERHAKPNVSLENSWDVYQP